MCFDELDWIIRVRMSICRKYKMCHLMPLRKRAYSTILRILPPKNENFQMKHSDIFLISAQNIDCRYSLEPPRWGGSNEYPQSMFWAEIRKIMYTPVNPSFTIQNWGLWGSKLYRHVFVMQYIHSYSHWYYAKAKSVYRPYRLNWLKEHH